MEKHQKIYQKGGINVIYTDFSSPIQCEEQTIKNEEQRVWVFSYCLSGTTCYKDQKTDEVMFTKGQCTTCIHQCCTGKRISAANSHIKQLRISVPEHELLDYCHKQTINKLAENVTSVKKLLSKDLSPHNLAEIQSLMWHIHYGDLLQAHINILNLLHDNITELGIQPSIKQNKFKQRDVRLAEEAKKLFDDDCTLRINDIADSLCVTEQKLRSVFYGYFNVSPKQYSLQVKMAKAQSLLATGLSISEIAYTLGYEFPNNFTLAFKKYFGQAPSLLNKNK